MLKKATRLEDVYLALAPRPLEPAELSEFYQGDINEVRGGDQVISLALDLKRAYGGLHCKRLLMGHPGVGKSTELTRLADQVQARYFLVRFRAFPELNPTQFEAFDLLYAMMHHLVTEAKRQGLGAWFQSEPGRKQLEAIADWLSDTKIVETKDRQLGLSLDKITSYLRFSSKEVRERFLHKPLADLIALMNALLEDVTEAARKKDREWLFLIEDFDKGLSKELVQRLFVDYRTVFDQLRCHFVFTIPVWLGYGDHRNQLPGDVKTIHDTPVFTEGHSPDTAGRQALLKILAARLDLTLLESSLAERFVVASGGNLRDLFDMVKEAADSAHLRGLSTIDLGAAKKAIDQKRNEVKQRLGGLDDKPSAKEKFECLVSVYQQGKQVIADSVVYSLLQSRSLLEFNGAGRYAVPPLVVDFLKLRGDLPANAPGGTD